MSSDLGQHLEMLQSSDPAQRRQAIIALGKSADKRALKPLGQVYKTDPDESLRQLALKAGRHIQKTTSAADEDALDIVATTPEVIEAPQPSSDVPDWMNQMGAAATPPPKTVTERDRKRAKVLYERAFDAQLHGNPEKVVDYIAEAIEVNPALEKDGTVIGLLAQATGMDGMSALKQLKQIAAEDTTKGKRRKKSGVMDWSETFDFFVEMGIWAIVISFIGAAILFLTVNNADWDEVKAEAATQGATEEELEAYDEIEEISEDYGDVFALIGGAAYGAMITLTSVFMSFITWFVGSTFMGGEGLIFPFLRAMMRVTAAVLLISTTATALTYWLSPTEGSDLAVILGLGPLVVGLALIGWTIGRVHGFGTAMGCFNMVGTIIACVVMTCGCSLASAL